MVSMEQTLWLCSFIKIYIQQCGVRGVDPFVRGNYKEQCNVALVTNSAPLHIQTSHLSEVILYLFTNKLDLD